MILNLIYVVSHPIQYQAPLLKLIASDPEIELFVIFESDYTSNNYFDEGFNRKIEWDVNLKDGYSFCLAENKKVIFAKIRDCDALWVHGWDSRFRRNLLKSAKQKNIPVLMRGENTLLAMPDGWGLKGFLKRKYLKMIFENCDAFLCIGKENKEFYRQHGVAEEKLFSMPYTVDNDFFRSHALLASKNKQSFRDSLGLASGHPIVLFVGKLTARKNPNILFDAFLELDHGKLKNPYLLYVGDGIMRAELENTGGELRDRIRFLGFKNQTELPAYYDLADVFVLPSEREPWGLVVNEAMNCSTAVIATQECGVSADLIDSSCGYVVPSGDKDALSEALTNCLEDSERCVAMGKKAKMKMTEWGLVDSISGLKDAIFFLKRD